MKHIQTFESFLTESNNWENDLYDTKKSLKRKYLAKPDDEITIEAAKQVAKQYKIKYQEILKTLTPSPNIKGAKTWDRDGNVIK